jgi:hypothetical protein
MNGCYPRNATGYFDFNAPYNQAIAIEAQCAYGPPMLQILTFAFDSGKYPAVNPGAPKLSPEAERTCICQSQHTSSNTRARTWKPTSTRRRSGTAT